jgi:mannose-6-phosphate isomerase-like protein (cupin superfamily)
MEPGGSALKHTHANSEQLYVVLSGSGEMTVGQESFHVQTGDTIYIPENVEHDTKVTGEEVFRCVVILAPPPRD